ncbi:uncharacterized protein KGF55_001581 [Candida pseudojiufengensis]|uniref:uncharacterized protein n=1 Tax=Candida pseudojiufengensis TaxID=497109 RepID=UPI002224AE85|nr:uncharacterized protein KGF55_001581 [Candida pseudojiufengensis]KAI5965360.1 hypothetical protein KGF55_001581 [Candida pseudojiufengensis]
MSVPKYLNLPNNSLNLNTTTNIPNLENNSSTQPPQSHSYAQSSTSSPFNPRTHRHKRSQAISGDFDGLGLFNIPPPSINNNNDSSIKSQHIYSKSISNPNTTSSTSLFGTTSNSSQISSSAPKERSVSFANDSRPSKLNLINSNEEDYELDRHFNFNNKEDFTNPIINLKTFEFPSPFQEDKGFNNTKEQQVIDDQNIYTTNFKKNLSSPIQLNKKISQNSLNSSLHNSKLQQQTNDFENIPDPIIDLNYIITANLHIGNSINDDTLIFNQDEFLGSPAIVEEDDDLENQTFSNEEDLEEEIEEEVVLNNSNENIISPQKLQNDNNNFYLSANSSTSSFNNNNLTTTSSNNNQNLNLNLTPNQQRSGAKANRYQIFYDQSNRISNILKGSSSVESIDRSNTPPPSNPPTPNFVPSLHLQQPNFKKNKYILNHSSSLPSLKQKRSFSSIRYNELKKFNSPNNCYQNYLNQSHYLNHNYNQNHNHNHIHNNQNQNQIIANNNNITNEYIEINSNLNPQIQFQSSTPSTLTTQSTIDTTDTLNNPNHHHNQNKAQSSTSPISINSEISIINNSNDLKFEQEKLVTPTIILNNENNLEDIPCNTKIEIIEPINIEKNNDFLSNELNEKDNKNNSFNSDSTLSNNNNNQVLSSSSLPKSIDDSLKFSKHENLKDQQVLDSQTQSKEVESQIQQQPQQQQPSSKSIKFSQPSSPSQDQTSQQQRRLPNSIETKILKQTTIPKLKNKTVNLSSPMNKYEYKKYPKRNEKEEERVKRTIMSKGRKDGKESGSDLLSISSTSTSSLSINSIEKNKKNGSSKTVTKDSSSTLSSSSSTINSKIKGHFRSKSNIENISTSSSTLSSSTPLSSSTKIKNSNRNSKFFDWIRKK